MFGELAWCTVNVLAIAFPVVPVVLQLGNGLVPRLMYTLVPYWCSGLHSISSSGLHPTICTGLPFLSCAALYLTWCTDSPTGSLLRSPSSAPHCTHVGRAISKTNYPTSHTTVATANRCALHVHQMCNGCASYVHEMYITHAYHVYLPHTVC